VSILTSANARGALQLAKGAAESWRTPSNEVASRRCAEDDSIFLLQGLAGSSRVLLPMRTYLGRELARPTIDLPLGVGFGDICDVAMRVHRELVEKRIHQCDVVGYSMGGLVAAYLLKCLDQGRCIRRVVTLGTPYQGVPFLNAWWWQLARWFRSAQQMRAGSAFLDHLRRIPPPAGTRILSIAGSDDTIVPPDAAHLEGPGYRSLVVPGLDHWTLPTSRRVFRCIREVLQSERGLLPSPRLASQALEVVVR
jgi:pimeloyl-ACP methyl ester carboxylesterase